MSNFVTDGENNQSVLRGPNPYSRWIKFLIRPSKAGLESIRDIASTPRTLIGFAIAWEIPTVIVLIVGIREEVELPGQVALMALLAPILWIIGYYLLQIIIWASAKILGGKGKYIEQSNLVALTAIPVALITTLFDFKLTVLENLPLYGFLINMPFQLYYFATIALALQAVHALSATKAWLIAIMLFVAYIAVAMLAIFGESLFLTYLTPY